MISVERWLLRSHSERSETGRKDWGIPDYARTELKISGNRIGLHANKRIYSLLNKQSEADNYNKKEKDLNESVKPLVTDSFGNLTKSKVQKDLTKRVFYCF